MFWETGGNVGVGVDVGVAGVGVNVGVSDGVVVGGVGVNVGVGGSGIGPPMAASASAACTNP
jgi:hypothetical protein